MVNIACGQRVSVNQIIARINTLLGKQIEPVYEPDRPGDVKHSAADISRARELIGYEPVIDFDDGLGRAINWYQEHLG